MRLDQKSMAMKRMMESMRPLTEAEISERQRLAASGMQNAGMRHVTGMENLWATNECHFIPNKPKPTFWQRIKRLLMTTKSP